MKSLLYLFLSSFLFFSCSIEPSPINYGNDECAFCMMKIMDQRFGAELVTEKGKIKKFDSAECMLLHLNEDKEVNAFELVTHVTEPEALKNADESFFVISEKIPSPMGGNLSSYPDIRQANAVVNEVGGELYTWEELMTLYASKKQ